MRGKGGKTLLRELLGPRLLCESLRKIFCGGG